MIENIIFIERELNLTCKKSDFEQPLAIVHLQCGIDSKTVQGLSLALEKIRILINQN